MKPLIAFKIVFLILCQTTFLQADWGVQGGWTNSVLSGNSVEKKEYINGFTMWTASVYYHWKFYNQFGIETEFMFTTKGGNIIEIEYLMNDSFDVIRNQKKIHADYIEIPILLTFALPQIKTLLPKIFLGPAYDYRSTDYYHFSNNGGNFPFPKDEFELKRHDFSLTFGGRIGFMLDDKNTLSLDIRYVRGLSKVNAKANDDVYNNSFSFMFGYYRR